MRGMVRKPRLLLATIWVTGALLVVKAVSLGAGLLNAGIAPTFSRGFALRASVVSAAEAASAEPPTHPLGAAKGMASSASTSATASTVEPVQTPPEPPISAAERQLLQDLRNRRLELDVRERTLTDRAGMLEAAERRLLSRIAELSGLQARLETMEKDRRTHDDANWAGLVKLYETMKPRDAAIIFNDMEMAVLLQVVDRMRDTKASAVLAAMQPDRARLLTAQLAALRTRSVTVPDRTGPG